MNSAEHQCWCSSVQTWMCCSNTLKHHMCSSVQFCKGRHCTAQFCAVLRSRLRSIAVHTSIWLRRGRHRRPGGTAPRSSRWQHRRLQPPGWRDLPLWRRHTSRAARAAARSRRLAPMTSVNCAVEAGPLEVQELRIASDGLAERCRLEGNAQARTPPHGLSVGV